MEQVQQSIKQMPQTNQKLQTLTILLIFLIIILIQIFAISLLIIFVKKIKTLLLSKTKPYYYCLLMAISFKLIICVFMQVKILMGLPAQINDLSSDEMQQYFKNTLIVGDFSIILLFLIAFQNYMSKCFALLEFKKIEVVFRKILKMIQITIFSMLIILLFLFNFDLLKYQIINTISAVLNLLTIVAFLGSFFYLNFQMTGLMIDMSINTNMKKIYKLLIVLFISRAIMTTFEILIFIELSNGSFAGFIQTIEDKQGQYVTFGFLFILYVLFILLTQGLPMIMSLRASTVEAFNHKIIHEYIQNQSMISSNNSFLEQALIDEKQKQQNNISDEIDDNQQSIQLKHFTIIQQIQSKTQQLRIIKAKKDQKEYILRQFKNDVSNYIKEDIVANIEDIKNSKCPINKVLFFAQQDTIYLVLDRIIEKCQKIQDKLKISLKIALAIGELHKKQKVYGCLKPTNITFDSKQNIFFTGHGFAFNSLKKFLALTSNYTNKSLYTAIQLLTDRHLIILNPQKPADIYSFGIIFYEILTLNHKYRSLSLKEIKQKFCNENFRPKIPDSLDDSLKNLIRKCWQANPLERPKIETIIQIIGKLVK